MQRRSDSQMGTYLPPDIAGEVREFSHRPCPRTPPLLKGTPSGPHWVVLTSHCCPLQVATGAGSRRDPTLAGLLGARGADMCCSAAECQIGISLLATPFLRKGGALRGRMMPLGCARTRSYRLYCSYIPIELFKVQRQNRRYALRDRIAP